MMNTEGIAEIFKRVRIEKPLLQYLKVVGTLKDINRIFKPCNLAWG